MPFSRHKPLMPRHTYRNHDVVADFSRFRPILQGVLMTTTITALAFALLLAIAALYRENRFRRALQALLRRVFDYWRTDENHQDSSGSGRSRSDSRM